MQIVALVGPSGTGKSYRAASVASSREIEYIIDDGLLIRGSKRIAGQSAKRERTKVGAVKRALFTEQEHRDHMIQALESEKPQKILILGTSDAMVQRIADNLNMGVIEDTVYIHDIATKQEIQTAREQRIQHGKHVIPVPAVELKQDFSGYFLDRLSIFRGRRGKHVQMTEKTVVRPTFSYLGHYTIANRTLVQIIGYVAGRTPGIAKVMRIQINKYSYGIDVEIDVALKSGVAIVPVCTAAQASVKEQLEWMTNINVMKVNIQAKTVYTYTNF
jgi:ribose 1,5-bisphosphokinase PhnN